MSTPSKQNAFAVLMGNKKNTIPSSSARQQQRRLSSGLTQFVPCPAGCGKRMLDKDMNAHLDQCIGGDDPSSRSHVDPEEVVAGRSQPPVVDSQSSQRQVSHEFSRISQDRHKGSVPKKRRVICPACEKSFPTSLINLHLDQCVRSNNGARELPKRVKKCEEQRIGMNAKPISPAKSEAAIALSLDDDDGSVISNESIKDPLVTNDLVGVITAVTDSNEDGTCEVESSINVVESQSSSLDVKIAGSTTPKPHELNLAAAVSQKSPHSERLSVFATMMKQSKSASAREKATCAITTLQQSFHLNDHCDVSLNLRGTLPADQEWTRPSWSALVNVKDKLHRDDKRLPLTLEVTLSSAIPSHTTMTSPVRQWVRKHSRLSVPVLKSILQKAIRRRRPLPAVRVAMELADKSLGDLLRRLPVILLEDSTLHPDIDLLTWIMMAHSKDFVPPPRLLVRVFMIVYEVASCQYSDSLRVKDNEEDGNGNNVTTLTSLSETTNIEALSASLSKEAALVWSILVRAEYGGMKGDVEMLHGYAQLWNQRFATVNVPEAIAARLTGSVADPSTRVVTWDSIPSRIHEMARKQSTDRVTLTCINGIDRLVLEDICLEGVDFHCSSVIDELLMDQELCGICHDLIVLSGADSGDIPDSVEGRCLRLEGILKHCMWTLSSGVNLRRPLAMDPSASASSKDRYKELWKELIAPRALAYQKKYVEQRLA